MREVLDRHPDVVELARTAIREAGLEPIEKPIRGGTDGSRLSFMGLPTPNLFAGEHNFHSRLEWVSRYDMDKAVEVIVNLSPPVGPTARLLQGEVHRHGHDDRHGTPFTLRRRELPLLDRVERRLIEERDRPEHARVADVAGRGRWWLR